MSNKYSNGMWKSTSREQNTVSQGIFRALAEKPTGIALESMGINFNQTTGECEYNFYFADGFKTVYYVALNRAGLIVNSGYTTR